MYHRINKHACTTHSYPKQRLKTLEFGYDPSPLGSCQSGRKTIAFYGFSDNASGKMSVRIDRQSNTFVKSGKPSSLDLYFFRTSDRTEALPMPLAPTPVFRAAIVPWYDTETVCLVVIFFLSLVVLYCLAGIVVALEAPHYTRHIWVPIVLVLLSGGTIISTLIRLLRRYAARN